MEKVVPDQMTYTAWRRVLPVSPCPSRPGVSLIELYYPSSDLVQNGKTEYKSLTVCADATAEEFMDIYLDDDGRPSWDTMIVQHEVLEHGDFSQRQQVVRWIRKFPFSFISGGSEGSICCLCCQQCGAI